MRFRVFVSLLLITLYNQVSGQGEVSPSGVMVKGNVVDHSSGDAVKARIQYESLPYGNKIGIFSGDDFTFDMEPGQDYMLTVTAEGYAPYSLILKQADYPSGSTEKLIELQPTGVDDIIRLDKLIFALGRAEITEDSHEELDGLVNMLNSNINMTIQLEGHTDFRGNPRQNMKLSEKRVQAVKSYLVRKGIDKKRITTKAFGGTQPISRSSDNEARSSNRRVEVRITSN